MKGPKIKMNLEEIMKIRTGSGTVCSVGGFRQVVGNVRMILALQHLNPSVTDKPEMKIIIMYIVSTHVFCSCLFPQKVNLGMGTRSMDTRSTCGGQIKGHIIKSPVGVLNETMKWRQH